MKKPTKKAIVIQKKTVRMYAELRHASNCVLKRGNENPEGSSYQFLSSIVLTAFVFEAYLNHVGKSLLDCWESVESLSPLKKLDLICELLKVERKTAFPAGERPLQTLTQLIDFRNQMAHGKTKDIEPKRVSCDPNHADARLRLVPLADWEKLINSKEFAERASADIEEILNIVHAARPEPKERLFAFGLGSGSAFMDGSSDAFIAYDDVEP